MDLRRAFTNRAWWGKVLCAFLGFLVAGPIGAFLGIFIGNLFDRGLAEHFTNPLWYYHAEKRPAVKKIFVEAMFSTLGHIAKADGRVSEHEIQMAKTLMQQMNLTSIQKKEAQYFFNEGKKEQFKLKQMITLLHKTIYDNPNLVKLFISTQYTAAKLDGLSEKKMAIINTILNYMRYAPIHEQPRFNDHVHHQPRQPHDALAAAFTVLQIQPTSNKQDVKRAYRRLISKNHPDKLIAQGLSKDKIKAANEKTQMICKAYEQICASKGW